MHYTCLNGGKRLRATLAYAAGGLFNTPGSVLDVPASAVEMIHAYSLVHDDLPAMDDDDLRRGKPSCHKAFDEATAILAGDALQSLAIEVLANDPALNVDPSVRLQMISHLAHSSGTEGMAGGQGLDLDAEQRALDLDALTTIHKKKTGALIQSAVALGALASNKAEPFQLQALDHYAETIGLAFQVVDDILDETSTTESLGKPAGSDRAMNKTTYPSLIGLDSARSQVNNLRDEALTSLDPLRASHSGGVALFESLAHFIVDRTH